MSIDSTPTVLKRAAGVTPSAPAPACSTDGRRSLSQQRVDERLLNGHRTEEIVVGVLTIGTAVGIEHQATARRVMFIHAQASNVVGAVNKSYKPERVRRFTHSFSEFTNQRAFKRNPIRRVKNHVCCLGESLQK